MNLFLLCSEELAHALLKVWKAFQKRVSVFQGLREVGRIIA